MVKPGPIGSLSSSGTFRIPGTMLEQNAIRQLRTIAEEQKAQTPLPVLAQLGQYIALGLDGRVAEDVAVEIQSARAVFLERFAELDANARAFLTGVLGTRSALRNFRSTFLGAERVPSAPARNSESIPFPSLSDGTWENDGCALSLPR